MSILDGLLAQATGGNLDIQALAQKVGLPPDKAEQALAALGQAHQQDGDTVQTAAENTGLPTDKLSALVQHMGGEESLGQFASLLGPSGEDGGSPLSGLKSFL